MSKEAVAEYFKKLVNDEDFANKIFEAGDNNEAKIKIIREYGMEFTKEEFFDFTEEYKEHYVSGIGELSDDDLEDINGGAIIGGTWHGIILFGIPFGKVAKNGKKFKLFDPKDSK